MKVTRTVWIIGALALAIAVWLYAPGTGEYADFLRGGSALAIIALAGYWMYSQARKPTAGV